MKPTQRLLLIAAACLSGASAWHSTTWAQEPSFQDMFSMTRHDLAPRGTNPYFIPLVPGYKLLLEGEEDSETVRVLIAVLPGTKLVDGVRCAIVRETEWVDGELVEVSWNYFAVSRAHNGVFYFGEDVDDYEDGEVVGHGGAWLAGKEGAKAGLIMPGYPLLGSRYYQEIAPDVALDRAEHVSVTAIVATPAGTFENCLMVEETSGLNPEEISFKFYAPGIGLVQDNELKLVDFGFKVAVPSEADDD